MLVPVNKLLSKLTHISPYLLATIAGLALFCGVGFGLAERMIAKDPRYLLKADEGISLLAATCHQGEYSN